VFSLVFPARRSALLASTDCGVTVLRLSRSCGSTVVTVFPVVMVITMPMTCTTAANGTSVETGRPSELDDSQSRSGLPPEIFQEESTILYK
jgi:hypothetical protein